MHGLRSHWKFILIAAWALGFLGVGLHYSADHGSDVPLPGEWATEAAQLYRPWLHRPTFAEATAGPTAVGDPGARLIKLGWLHLNGQWDPRLLALAALGLFALAGIIFFAAILGELSALSGLALVAVATAFLLFPGVLVHLLDPGQTWAGLLLLLSLAHLAGTARCRPGSAGGLVAQLAGLLNVLTSTAGLASPLAALGWISLGRRPGGAAAPPGLKAWNALLVILGLGRAVAFGGLVRSAGHASAGWPLSFPGAALVAAAPAIALLVRTQVSAGTIERSETRQFSLIRLLSIWILILAALFAGSGIVPPGASPASILAFGLFVQFAAVLAFPAEDRGRLAKLLLGAAWLILVCNGLFQQSRVLPGIDEEVATVRARAAAVRQFLAHSEAETLAPAIEGGGIAAPAAAELLTDPLFQRILPSAIRPGLPLIGDAPAEAQRAKAGRFAREDTSAIEGKPAFLPAWAAGRSGESLFVSEPLSTAAPMLQIYVAGRLDPPASSLVLRTADGREVPPTEARADATSRWKQLNFVTPRQPFRVVARSSGAWLAFSAPIAAGQFSWLGRKAVSSWPLLLGLSLVLFSAAGAGAVLAWRKDGSPPLLAPGLARYAPWLALFAYGLFLANFLDTVAAGADASGYLNSAKLLYHGHLAFPPREISGISISPPLLAPLGFGAAHGRIVPGYPVGLPLLLAAAGHVLTFEHAIPVVIVIDLLLGVYFTFRLAGICGLSRTWSWIAAAAVALCPLYVFMGLQPMSDGPSLVAVTAALYFSLASRARPNLALGAGAAAALAVLLRPANAICLLPVALAFGWSPRRLAACAAGGLPGAIFAAWYNRRLYGSAFSTGYGDVSSSFGIAWVEPTLRHYAIWITALLTPLVWLAVLSPWLGPPARRVRLVLAVAIAGYLGFYAFYSFTHETWWYLRFVLPAFPCLAILALAVLGALIGRARESRQVVVAAALLALAAGDAAWAYSRLPVLQSGRGNEVYRRSARWVDRHLPADAVILAYQTSGALVFYTRHPIVRSEVINTAEVADAVRRLVARRVPVYALTFRFDSMPAFSSLPGRWESIAGLDEATVWCLVPPGA